MRTATEQVHRLVGTGHGLLKGKYVSQLPWILQVAIISNVESRAVCIDFPAFLYHLDKSIKHGSFRIEYENDVCNENRFVDVVNKSAQSCGLDVCFVLFF